MKKPRKPIARSSSPRRKTRVKQRSAKRGAEIARTHGTPAYRVWLAEQACMACGMFGHSQAAHLLGPLGMGIKKDWTTTAPLCGPRPSNDPTLSKVLSGVMYVGCHKLYDLNKAQFFRRFPDFNAEQAVALTQEMWRSHERTA